MKAASTRGRWWIAIGLLIGLPLGWTVAHLESDGRTRDARGGVLPRAPDTLAESEPPRATIGAPPAPADPRVDASLPPAGDDGEQRVAPASTLPLLHEGLLEFARGGIRSGWSESRPEPLPDLLLGEGMEDFERSVRAKPLAIGRALARRQDEYERAVSHGDGFLLLEKMLAGQAGEEPLSVASDPEAFERFFKRRTVGGSLNGLDFVEASGETAGDGATLSFPPGVFRLRKFMRGTKGFPRDLTIRGAGIDRTLLVVEELSTRATLTNLSIQDCTVSAGYLFDLRREGCSFLFERVRFVGFDIGAGSSCLISAPSALVLARDCRFEGGYGRSPRSGVVFDVRSSGLLARFERCRLFQVAIGSVHYSDGARLVFVGCELENVFERPTSSEAMTFLGCSIDDFDSGTDEVVTLDLDHLFPGWEEAAGR